MDKNARFVAYVFNAALNDKYTVSWVGIDNAPALSQVETLAQEKLVADDIFNSNKLVITRLAPYVPCAMLGSRVDEAPILITDDTIYLVVRGKSEKPDGSIGTLNKSSADELVIPGEMEVATETESTSGTMSTAVTEVSGEVGADSTTKTEYTSCRLKASYSRYGRALALSNGRCTTLWFKGSPTIANAGAAPVDARRVRSFSARNCRRPGPPTTAVTFFVDLQRWKT
ncbi:hypothetical protein ON010_g10546 [Phytophthora cinnamomi]|nr:hypothetical protein ON010_g10546 [Phytophthora cinnamomi]